MAFSIFRDCPVIGNNPAYPMKSFRQGLMSACFVPEFVLGAWDRAGK